MHSALSSGRSLRKQPPRSVGRAYEAAQQAEAEARRAVLQSQIRQEAAEADATALREEVASLLEKDVAVLAAEAEALPVDAVGGSANLEALSNQLARVRREQGAFAEAEMLSRKILDEYTAKDVEASLPAAPATTAPATAPALA